MTENIQSNKLAVHHCYRSTNDKWYVCRNKWIRFLRYLMFWEQQSIRLVCINCILYRCLCIFRGKEDLHKHVSFYQRVFFLIKPYSYGIPWAGLKYCGGQHNPFNLFSDYYLQDPRKFQSLGDGVLKMYRPLEIHSDIGRWRRPITFHNKKCHL